MYEVQLKIDEDNANLKGWRFMQSLTVNTANASIKILQGSAVTRTMLGGLTVYSSVANFL